MRKAGQTDPHVVRHSELHDWLWAADRQYSGFTVRAAFAKLLGEVMIWQVPEEEGVRDLNLRKCLHGMHEGDDAVVIMCCASPFLRDMGAESGWWPEAVRLHGGLQEIPEQRLSGQPGPAQLVDQVSHLHDLLVELGRSIEDSNDRLATGVRVKHALQEVVARTSDHRLKRHRELSTLMLDAVRHVPSEILTVRHVSALEECTDRLSQARLTQDDLAVCDSALLAAGLDSLPDIGDDDE